MEGDTTNFYIFKRLKDTNIKLSVIARGISIGDELEYADEVTLGRSILNRTPYENSLFNNSYDSNFYSFHNIGLFLVLILISYLSGKSDSNEAFFLEISNLHGMLLLLE